jgi:predicted SprT family Zn-dependent metalloprotease
MCVAIVDEPHLHAHLTGPGHGRVHHLRPLRQQGLDYEILLSQWRKTTHNFLHSVHIIDISCLDWAYKSSTCDAMYRRQRRHLYYGGEIYKYYLAPSTAALPS